MRHILFQNDFCIAFATVNVFVIEVSKEKFGTNIAKGSNSEMDEAVLQGLT